MISMHWSHRWVLGAALAALLALGGRAFLTPAAADAPPPAGTERAVFAGGCFWGMELVFDNVRGVVRATPGFAGGSAATAHYEIVSTGTTHHAESVEVVYDPRVVSYQQLLQVYFRVAHDPTELDRQGPDEGTQYRSTVFYANDAQRAQAQAAIAQLTAQHVFPAPVVTTLEPLHGFYPAEAYHLHYAVRHPDDPYIVVNDLPKLAHLRAAYPQLTKPQQAAIR
ncbi:MAG TPA: peptide-methionine (S)-S-oxide reductase MsrA [Candidatus Sulfotelmatobacter sp.]|nr:peptide-methionine (S)-S-oxide reductase MsrA [Candidatus Sulfotelmatobacter sp.]